jgi:hypothetical protein
MTGSTSLALPDARVPLKDGIPLSERHNETFQDLVSSLGGQKAKAMLGMTAEFDQGEFRKDCERLRKRMRDQTLGLLQPRGIFIQYWDMVTGMALLYTLFVTTFEVGLDIPTKIDGLFVANQIVALLFLSDICVQFFLPVPDPSKGEGSFERRHVVLAKKYLKGWFMLDVVTIIPFDVLVYASVLTGPVKGTKLLRIMRLIKLLKVLKGSAIIERWQSQIASEHQSPPPPPPARWWEERERKRERERLAGGRTLLAWLAGCSLALVGPRTCLAWFIHPACGLGEVDFVVLSGRSCPNNNM